MTFEYDRRAQRWSVTQEIPSRKKSWDDMSWDDVPGDGPSEYMRRYVRRHPPEGAKELAE